MGRPVGSPNKHKPFRAALNRLLDEAGSDPKRLEQIAAALISKAQTGDVQAIKEIADRLDGKVPQAIVGDSEHDPLQVEQVVRTIVDSGHSHGGGVPRAPAAS